MKILVDPHCHLYPCFDVEKSLLQAKQHSLVSPFALFLVERADCSYFDQLPILFSTHSELQVSQIDTNCLRMADQLYVLRGRQFSTLEGIEVLSLFAAPDLPEKLSALEYSLAIQAAGGLIAFSWAFGKWRGTRQGLIKSIALKLGPNQVLLLDSSLRPEQLELPTAFNELSKLGFRILAGSDPLPLKNHQNNLGRLRTEFEVNTETPQSLNSQIIKSALLNADLIQVAGKHSGLLNFVWDQSLLRLPQKKLKSR